MELEERLRSEVSGSIPHAEISCHCMCMAKSIDGFINRRKRLCKLSPRVHMENRGRAVVGVQSRLGVGGGGNDLFHVCRLDRGLGDIKFYFRF